MLQEALAVLPHAPHGEKGPVEAAPVTLLESPRFHSLPLPDPSQFLGLLLTLKAVADLPS